jgi:hypothetical protein
MEIPNQIKCDNCGAVKGETNHWISCITIPPAEKAPGEDGIAFGPLEATITDPRLKIEHLCGEACATKRLSQWLTARK